MGAWIEMPDIVGSWFAIPSSHPLWVRGLKYQKGTPQVFCLRVAPFMGAWIEIYMKNEGEKFMKVAPFMGAWIEIRNNEKSRSKKRSRTLYGCVD